MSKNLILRFAIIGTDPNTKDQVKLGTKAVQLKAEEQICKVQERVRGKLCHPSQISRCIPTHLNQAKSKTWPANISWSLIQPNACFCLLLKANVGFGFSRNAPLQTTWRG